MTTLALTYGDLRDAIGSELRFGPTSASWTGDTTKTAQVNDCLRSGLRRAYSPPATPMQRPGYEWKFLKPTVNIELKSAQEDYLLPVDYGRIEGHMTISSASRLYVDLYQCSEQQIRQERSTDGNLTAQPLKFATRWSRPSGASPSVLELLVWPKPDQDYTAQARVALRALNLEDNAYPHGGPEHAEMILEACLSVAEERYNRGRGPHWQAFIERLDASIAIDRRSGPETNGAMRQDDEAEEYLHPLPWRAAFTTPWSWP